MKAVAYEKMGPADQVLKVVDLPTPDVGEDDVLVRLHASGVNPTDVKLRAGVRPGFATMPWPLIVPHSDGAGVIEAVGDAVPRKRIGERVWVYNGQWQRQFGTAAEYIALPAAQAVPLPEAETFEHGACMGIPAMTAYYGVMAEGDVAGKTVLVSGGGGVVGRYAVQIAAAKGATVIATAGSAATTNVARLAGAAHVINYKTEDLVEGVMAFTDGRGLDHAVEAEFGADIDALAEVIKPNGSICAYGSTHAPTPTIPFYRLMTKSILMRTVIVYILPSDLRKMTVDGVCDMLAKGQITANIARVFKPEEAAAAHRLVETGEKSGSVLIGF